MLYCSNISKLSLDEYPLVPYARLCKYRGWFTICLQNVYTGNVIYVLEFFLSTRSKDNENVLTTLKFILGTMEKKFKTFRLASGKELGGLMSVDIIYFQNDQKIHFVQSIQATRDFSMSSIASSVQSSASVANTRPGFQDANMGTINAEYDLNFDSSSDSNHSFEQSTTSVHMEFGLRWFNGKQDCMQHGYAYQAREDENVYTGNDIYVLEFFLSTRSKDNENILTTLNFILGTMEKNFKTFRLASGKELGELMSLEVIYFQNDQKIQFVQSQGSHDANMVTSKAKYDLNCELFSDSDSSSDSDPSFMQSSTRVANARPRFQDADLVTIKVKYASTERVLKLSLPCRLVELQEEVAIWLAGTYHVGYKDEEDGFVLIACDEDLQAYIDDSISQGNTSPTVLLEPKEPATNFNPNN
ncbi:hypothetical protein Vadar_029943 [Vaccinium darrowii]|uniref:Uncharacterized protein n=1 Tax=Vaccinium darrowii TaxID=229202 RepID=A0ACB7XKX2_9ERIC|nr:hypothetical protein Vadar_029943 [Vaccinium darrowii]